MTDTTPTKPRRYADPYKAERMSGRLLRQNNAVATRLGYDTMAQLVGALRGALVNAASEGDAYINLGDLLRGMIAANERRAPAAEAMYDPPADLAAIMAAHPRRKKGSQKTDQ